MNQTDLLIRKLERDLNYYKKQSKRMSFDTKMMICWIFQPINIMIICSLIMMTILITNFI